MKRFSEYADLREGSLEADKRVVFCWGRFNPPTRGHEKVFDVAHDKAEDEKASFYIFTSQTEDDDKNPLDYPRKIKTLERYFPQYAVNVVRNTKIKTLFDVVRVLKSNEFTHGTLVVGQDRKDTFQDQMKYFDGIHVDVISAGDRSEAEGDEFEVENISGQMLRDFVRKGDFKSFMMGSPHGVEKEKVEDVFHAIRRRYGLPGTKKTEAVVIATTEEREKFFEGAFEAGDKVLSNTTNQIGEVKSIGSNYLNILFLGETKSKRTWPWDVTKL